MLATTSEAVRPNRGGWGTVVAQFWIVGLLILLGMLYSLFDPRPEPLVYPACLLLVLLSVWSFWSWRFLTGKLFDPSLLFFAAAVIFNGGHAFLEVFHLNERGIMFGRFSSETILHSLFLVTIGLMSLQLGAMLSQSATNTAPRTQKPKLGRLVPTQQDIRWVGWGLLAVSIYPSFLTLRSSVSIVRSSGYFALYQQASRTSFGAVSQILSGFLVPAALFLLAGSKKRTGGLVASALVIFVYALVQFFLGRRAWAVMPLIAYAWLWHRCIRPLPKALLLGVAVVTLVIVFPLLKVIRNVSGEERSSLSFMMDAFLSIENPAVGIISEMGGSMRTVAHTLELVPSVRDFDMGAGYAYGALTVIPNLFWDVHPAVAHGLPSDWLTWTIEPIIAATGGGVGYSFIAEAYFNFGWLGAPAALAVIGFLFGRLRSWAVESGEPARMAMLASFLAFVLFAVRQEMSIQVRSLVWNAFIPYLGVYVVSFFRARIEGSEDSLISS